MDLPTNLPRRAALRSIAAALALLGSAFWQPVLNGADARGDAGGSRGKAERRPNTRIIAAPAALIPVNQPARFVFTARRRANFDCRFDRRRWRACAPPETYRHLAAGQHLFEVRARRRGLREANPARRRFEVLPAEIEGGIDGTTDVPTPPAFAANGVWTTPLAATTPVDPRSEALVATLVASVHAQLEDGVGPGLVTRARTPVYEVGAGATRVPVVLDSGPWVDELRFALSDGVPVPVDALPSPGSDRMMAVWQPSSDTYWEFFAMQQALHPPQFLRYQTSVGSGGSLSAGSYRYSLTALNSHGETTAAPSGLEVDVGADGSRVEIRWAPIEGASGYRVYREEGAGPALLATVAAGSDRYIDDGDTTPNGPPPPASNSAVTPGQWRAGTGGKIESASLNPGYYQDVIGLDGLPRQRYFWGASATSLPLLGGLITKRDLELGRIDHTLSIGLPNLSPATSIIADDVWAFPAQRSDGKSTRAEAIPQGTRFRLDPALNLDSIELSPTARMLAEAAQRYGMIVHGGSRATVIYGEDPSPYERLGQPNFYETHLGPRPAGGYVQGFPWEHLQVVEAGLCEDPARPCSAAGQA